MVLHVWERVSAYSRLERLIVATDDESISQLIVHNGGEVVLSSEPFKNGSERCASAITEIDCDVCIDIQGDEISIRPEQLERTVQVLENNPDLKVATAAFPIPQAEHLGDPNLVKVAVDVSGCAIDFSRKPITIAGQNITNYGHAGIYVYRKDFLIEYARLPQTSREIAESLEQLRILEHGHKIGVAIINKPLLSVNTPEDLALANRVFSQEGGVI